MPVHPPPSEIAAATAERRIFEFFRGGGRGSFVLRGEEHARPRRGEMLDAVVIVPVGEEEDAFDALRTTSPRGPAALPDVGPWREVVAARNAPVVRADWRCQADTAACPGTQSSLTKDWICTACGRRAHAPKTWRDKGLKEKPKTYEPGEDKP